MPNTNTGQLISMMFATSRLIQERTKHQGKMDPLSYLRLGILQYVTEKENPLMKEIADYLRITPPSATSLVNSLVSEKQLERVYDKNDRRRIHLVITPKGKKILVTEFKKITKRMEKVLKKLSDKERNDLMKILKKLSQVYSNNKK